MRQPKKFLFVCNRGVTVQYHGCLRSRELGQAPMLLMFLTPRQALSSHPQQQMVWLQDRDSVPNWYNVVLVHCTYSMTHCCSPMTLSTAGCIPQGKLQFLYTWPPVPVMKSGIPSVHIPTLVLIDRLMSFTFT